jgi:sensor histidine kinase regulating citrate/malate metabolism
MKKVNRPFHIRVYITVSKPAILYNTDTGQLLLMPGGWLMASKTTPDYSTLHPSNKLRLHARGRPHISLQTAATLLISAIIAGVLLIAYSSSSTAMQKEVLANLENRTMMLARTVAFMPAAKEALENEDKELRESLQVYTRQLLTVNDVRFIVVMDMNRIRLTHPDPVQIGGRFAGGDEAAVMTGRSYLSNGEGTLGYSLRAFVPVYNNVGSQIGAVAVGISMNDVYAEIKKTKDVILYSAIASSIAGLVGAIGLALALKRKLHGYEPIEISLLAHEREAILHSTREGILAVNPKLEPIYLNRQAEELLPKEEWMRQPELRELVLYVLRTALRCYDEELEVAGIPIMASIVPLRFQQETTGVVISFRDMSKWRSLNTRLAGLSAYADALRSKSHEFMNKLHVILGMLHMKRYDELRDYVAEAARLHQSELGFISRQVKEPVLAGFLLGKLSLAREQGIAMSVTPDSYVPKAVDSSILQDLVTILGNLLGNAMEELAGTQDGRIELELDWRDGELIAEIHDNGRGLPPPIEESMYKKGISGKGSDRGLGLYLVQQCLRRLRGDITHHTSPETGTCFVLNIPYAGEENEP